MPRLLYAINMIVIGYVLNISAILLNHLDGDKNGVALALISFAAAYISESDYVFGTKYPFMTRVFQYISITACVLSLVLWYL